MDRRGNIVLGISNNAKIKFDVESLDWEDGTGLDCLEITVESGDNQDFWTTIKINAITEKKLDEICSQISSLKKKLKYNKGD